MSRTDLRALKCPSCGGGVDLPPGVLNTHCPYCGTPVRRDDASGDAGGRLTGIVSARTISKRALLIIGCVFAVVVLAVAVPIGRSLWSTVHRQREHMAATQAALAEREILRVQFLAGRGGGSSSPELLLTTVNRPRGQAGLALAQVESGRILWDEQPFGGPDAPHAIVWDETRIYAASGMQLVAMDRETGKVAWTAVMSDQAACSICLQATGDAAVVLTRDGRVQGYERGTGRPQWVKRLQSTPRALIRLKDAVAVVDEDRAIAVIRVFDAGTGRTLSQIAPACAMSTGGSFDEGSSILVDSVGASLFLIYGSGSRCIERWQPRPGRLAWRGVTGGAEIRHPVLVGDALLAEADGRLFSIDVATGAIRTPVDDPDYAIHLLGVQNGVAAVQAERLRGTHRFEFWGVDLARGKGLWQRPLHERMEVAGVGAESAKPVVRNARGDARMLAILTAAGLVGLQGGAERSGEIIVEASDIRTGASLSRRALPSSGPTGGVLEVSSIESFGSMVALIVAHRLVLMDVATGTVRTWAGGNAFRSGMMSAAAP